MSAAVKSSRGAFRPGDGRKPELGQDDPHYAISNMPKPRPYTLFRAGDGP